jgi:RNA polymerase sigma-70 factor (family 1)
LDFTTHTDSQLLKAIQQNDEQAFAELFHRYWENTYALTLARIRSEEVTKEIVQEIFISIWKKRSTLSIDHVPSYLFVATKNRIINYIASQTVLRKHQDYYNSFVPANANVTDNDVELNELMEALAYGIDQLPEKSRTIFKLNRMDGRSIWEIANILNLSEKAIQYHITQSIKKLRLHLKDYILAIAFYGLSCFI